MNNTLLLAGSTRAVSALGPKRLIHGIIVLGGIVAFVGLIQASVKSGDRALPYGVLWGPALGDVAEVSRYVQKPEGLLFENGRVQRLSTSDLAKKPTHEGDFRYVGVDDNA